MEKGEYSKGLKYNEEYLRRSRDLQDAVLEQRALANLGWTYYTMAISDKEMFSQALRHFNKSLKAVGKISPTSLSRKELSEMRGRAFENIGKTYFVLEEKDHAEKHFKEAEVLFREFRLWSDLLRLTDTRANQILESASNSNLATALDQANKALEAAQKVGYEAEVEALCTIFKVHLLKRDFHEARKRLSEARNLKAGDMKRFIDNNLKMMIVIDECQDNIRTDKGVMSHCHFEKIADTLIQYESSGEERNKVLEISIEYYKKAYKRANEEGSTESLSSLNNSIAKTYGDMQDHDRALEYFEKQCKLDRDKPEDYCIALSNTAMTKESLKRTYDEVLELKEKWLDVATRSKLRSQQCEALQEILRYQRDNNRDEELRRTEARMEELGVSVSDREMSCSQGSDVSDKFPDIDLDREEEARVDQKRIAKRTPAEYTKTNNKGEYPLHLQLQRAGQRNKIITMIERGHPLEVKDNAGWSPLGEATGQMNLDYVKILVEAGANINQCNNNGETPLLVAAMRGWLDGIEYLLDQGAKVDIKSTRGENCLSFLNGHIAEGRKGDDPSYHRPRVMERLEAAARRVGQIFENLGLSTNVPAPLESDSPSLEDDLDYNDLTLIQDNIPPSYTSTQKRRRSPSPCSSPRSPSPLSRTLRASSPLPGRRMYQEAMESLKSSGARTLPEIAPKASNQRGAEEFSDDWLVDDVRDNKKKRRRQSLIDERTIGGSNRKTRVKENIEPAVASSPPIDLTSPILKPSRTSGKLKTSRAKSSKQPLISSLITRSRTPSPLPPVSEPSSPQRPEVNQLVPAVPACPAHHPQMSNILKVKVLISGEMFLVLVPDSSLTVGWLAKEAAGRYYRQVGTEPVLRLRTSDGAVLDPGDLVAHIFQPGEQLTADVLHWNTKPAAQKYEDACRELGVTCYKNIRGSLVNMSSNNNLSLRLSMKAHHVRPLFRSLRGNSGLRELELSQCKLGDEEVRLLGEILPTISHLASLNLSYNMMTDISLTLLSRLQLKVKELQLSGNMFGDGCLSSLTRLLSSQPSLETLGLARCGLTSQLFQSGRGQFSVEAKKSSLKELDLSHNLLTVLGVETLLGCLPSSLTKLNISRCNLAQISRPDSLASALLSHCSQGSQHANLTSLNLSSFCLSSLSLRALLPSLSQCGRLTQLELSNNQLTSQALLSVLSTVRHHALPLVRLSLASGSHRAAKLFWEDEGGLELVRDELESLLASNTCLLERLVVPLPLPTTHQAADTITRVWDSHYGARSLHFCDSLGNIEYNVQ